jgi:hypothetical protein
VPAHPAFSRGTKTSTAACGNAAVCLCRPTARARGHHVAWRWPSVVAGWHNHGSGCGRTGREALVAQPLGPTSDSLAALARQRVDRALDTSPLTDAERATVVDGIRRCYEAAGLEWHGRVVWAPSPWPGTLPP